MKIRIRFTKSQELKYIGHLDVMRLFQRAIRRTGLPIAYSKGFNPHQLLAFANPLSLGMTSAAEFGDFQFCEEISPKEVMEKLNTVLPQGITITNAIVLKENAKKAMADIAAADYLAVLDNQVTPAALEENLNLFLEQTEILIMKKTKHHEKQTDIRPDIYRLENKSSSDKAKILLHLAAGSERSIKPESVVKALYHFMGLPFDQYAIAYERRQFYRKDEAGALCPLDCGVQA